MKFVAAIVMKTNRKTSRVLLGETILFRGEVVLSGDGIPSLDSIPFEFKNKAPSQDEPSILHSVHKIIGVKHCIKNLEIVDVWEE